MIQSIILAQAIDIAELSQALSIKEIGLSGILIGIIYYFWKRTANLEIKFDDSIKQREETAKEHLRQREENSRQYYDLVIKTNEILNKSNEIINENNKIMQRLERLLDKKLE